MTTLNRRKVIQDRYVTDDIFQRLLYMVCTKLQDKEITQHAIIQAALPCKLSNGTIARIINELIPSAKATRGSVASQIRLINKPKNNPVDELLILIEENM